MNFKFKPDPRDHAPLYLQLSRKLGDVIRAGKYQAHDALPSERLLSETLNISRVTARKAIELLVEQGLIVRRQGSGNYIAPMIEQPLSLLTSFSEELSRRGYTPGSQWLVRELANARPDEQSTLRLAPGSKVARLKRLRLADDVVMALETSILPQRVVPRPELIEGSLYEHLVRTNNAPVRAQQHLRAMNAPPELAKQLGIAVGHAVFFITRVGYTESGQAVELTYSYCRNDYYDFVVELRREPGPA
jgi:GntR family transcriptional regulator